MSRTKRKVPVNGRSLRRPLHKNEEVKLLGILADCKVDDYKLSGVNRIHKRLNNLPNAYEDIVISSLFQEDYANYINLESELPLR